MNFSLYLVTDRSLCLGRPLADVVCSAVEGGVTMVQLREKECSTHEMVSLAQSLKTLLAPYNVPLIINDRIDVALAVDAEGVHLGQSDMPVEIARRLIGSKRILGLSVENLDHVRDAEKLPVDYLGVSPIFATPTKTDTAPAWGLEGLRQVRAITKRSLVAIGGINLANAKDVLDAGADGLAVVSAICSAQDPCAASKAFQKITKF